jgi:hypothetical protein
MAAFVVEDTTGNLRNYTTPRDAYPATSASPSPGPTSPGVDAAIVAAEKAAKEKAAEAVKLDDNARAACQVLVLNAADVTTKQDRSDLARAVNAYARQSDTPQIVEAGEFLTDSVGSWTGFMWTGPVSNFADVCDKGKAFR